MPPRRLKHVVDTGDEYERSDQNRHWHVSRSVPIAFIVSMLVYAVAQTATAAWFASNMNSRVEAVEKAQAMLAPTANTQGERLTRLEEKVEAVKGGIGDIKTDISSIRTLLSAQSKSGKP